MNKNFDSVDLVHAYKLITPGRTALIATKGKIETLYNLTPVAWIMPMDYEPVTKIIFSSDPNHQAALNIDRTKEFAVCIPADPNDSIIEKCGSLSSETADKFSLFGLTGEKATAINVMVPPDYLTAWIECRLIRSFKEGSVELFMGEAVAAFKER